MAQTLFPKMSQPWIAVKKEKKKGSRLVSLSLSLTATGMVVSVEDVLSRL